MDIIGRDQWGAVPPARAVGSVAHTHVEVHHGASPNPFADHNPAGAMRGYQRYHIDAKGWADIFYNLGLAYDGRLFEGRGIGKRSEGRALTVVLLGDYTNRPPSPAQKAVILELARQYGGVERIDWHNRRAAGTRYASACPGAATIEWLQQVRRAALDATPLTPVATPILEEDDDMLAGVIAYVDLCYAASGGAVADFKGRLYWVDEAMKPGNQAAAFAELKRQLGLS